MTFHTPIAPASAGEPNSLVGQIEFDTDANPATGDIPLQNRFGHPVPAVDAGIEFLVDYTSELAHPGEADVVSTALKDLTQSGACVWHGRIVRR